MQSGEELGFRFRPIPGRGEDVPEIIVRLQVARIVPQRLTITRNRRLKFAALFQDDAKIILRDPRVRVLG